MRHRNSTLARNTCSGFRHTEIGTGSNQDTKTAAGQEARARITEVLEQRLGETLAFAANTNHIKRTEKEPPRTCSVSLGRSGVFRPCAVSERRRGEDDKISHTVINSTTAHSALDSFKGDV